MAEQLHDEIERLDGLLLTGSPSNVEPHHYLGDPSEPGTWHDPERDIAALALILMPEYLRAFAEYRMLMFGAVMVLMMIFRPQGLVANVRKTYRVNTGGADD